VDLTAIVLGYVCQHTAGNPTDSSVKWTALCPKDIATHLKQAHGLTMSHRCIKRILKSDGYVRRKPLKCLQTGESKDREEQFGIVNFLKSLFESMDNNPILSIDTKKKEPLGLLTRNEKVLVRPSGVPKVFSSDYSHLATGKAIPQGIFDCKLDKGYITIGNSHETAAFIVDNLRWWWNGFGIHNYPQATHLLLLCDCGGANGYRHHLFKVLLQSLAAELGIRIVVAHYPPYCSKYNPIERKLFSHVHKTIENTILTDLEQVKSLMSKTSHSKGLSVEVRVVVKEHLLKRRSKKEDIDENRILRHPDLPKLSYTLLP
jgi:hypothetical protein